MPSPRLTVLGIALLLLVQCITTVGSTENAGSVTVPLPAVGDKGVYTLTRVTLAEDGRHVGPVEAVERFEWLAPARSMTTPGASASAARVFEHATSSGEEARTLREVDFSQGRTLAEAVIDVSQVGSETYYNRTYYRFLDAPTTLGYSTQTPFCGVFLPGVQGASFHLRDEATLFTSSCSLPSLSGIPLLAGTKFRAVEARVVDGIEVMAFVSIPDSRATVWLSSEFPYPIRISLDRSGGAGSEYDLYRLERFDRGGGSTVGTIPLPTTTQLADLAPREAWGPKPVTGTGLSLREAYEAARHGPGSQLQEFLEQHPDAYMAQANYGEILGGPSERREWHFTMTDAREQLLVSVERHRPQGDETRSEHKFGTTSPLVRSPNAGSETYDRITYSTAPIDPEQLPPPPHLVPYQLPTVQSGIEAWRAMGNSSLTTQEGKLWGFSISLERCQYQGDSCDKAKFRMEVGMREVLRTAEGPQLSSSLLILDENGRAIALDETYIWPVPQPASSEVPWSSSTLVATSVVPGSALDALPLSLTATSLVAVILIAVVAWLKWGGIFALYARILPSRDENATRRRLIGVIQSMPGIHRAEVARAAEIPESTARYHLRRLVALGAIVSARSNGFVTYRLRTTDPDEAVGSLFRSKGARAIIESVIVKPGATGRHISSKTGLTPATVTYHLDRMRRSGLLDVERNGKEIHVTLTGMGQDVWQRQLALTEREAHSPTQGRDGCTAVRSEVADS